MKLLILIATLFLTALSVQSQGVGLGTETPTEILHLYRDQNTIVGDVAIRHESLQAGTGPGGSVVLSGTSSNVAGADVDWSTPTGADASDGTYATATVGTSDQLLTDVNYTIPAAATITGVTAEIEGSISSNAVEALDAWAGEAQSDNITTSTYNYTVSAGTDRMLVVCVFQNNDNSDNHTLNDFVTYGGQNMVNQGVVQNGNNEDHTLEIWTLNETGIAAAGSTVLSFTWSSEIKDAQFYYSGSYQYVDQTTPVSASDINTANDVQVLQLASALAVNEGDMIISVAALGDDNETATQPSGYSKQVDVNYSSGPDGTFCVSSKAITAAGTEQPTSTFTGNNDEDMSVGAIVLNASSGSSTDNVVQLYSGGALIGNNEASGAAWTTTDTYVTYNFAATLPSVTEVNAGDFGLITVVDVVGGTAQIDHVRITVTYTMPPSVITEYTSGLDISTGNYVISGSSTLGTSDVMRMSTGTITFSVAAGVHSDRRYKKNISPLTSSLEKISLINGVSYNMKRGEFPEMSFSKDKQIGFIAQDLEKIYPELVRTDQGGYKSVTYATMTPILVEAIKELKVKIESLEKTVAALTEKNKELKSDVKAMDVLEIDIALLKNTMKAIMLDLDINNTSDK